jgi:hypothetical protein
MLVLCSLWQCLFLSDMFGNKSVCWAKKSNSHCFFSDDKSCTDYFSLPSFQMTFSKKPPQEGSVNEVEDNVQPITQAVTEVLDNTFATAVTYYKENLNPFVLTMYKTVVPYLPTFKGEYLRLVQYFPVLKEEEKVGVHLSKLSNYFCIVHFRPKLTPNCIFCLLRQVLRYIW